MPQSSLMRTLIGHCELIQVNNWVCYSVSHRFVFIINEQPCDANARITVSLSMPSRASLASEKRGKAKSTLLLLTKSTNSSVFLTNLACKLHGNCSSGPVPKHAVSIKQGYFVVHKSSLRDFCFVHHIWWKVQQGNSVITFLLVGTGLL